VDTWRAADLDVLLVHGAAVSTWNSASNRLASVVGSSPVFKKSATPSGASAVHFDHARLMVPSSPVAGLTNFSLVVVFKVDQAGVDDGSGWSTKSGLVDANQIGFTNDWGFSVRETGYVAFGTGNPAGSDQSLYLDNQPTYPSVVNGPYHVIICTWGAGSQITYLDSYPAKTQSGVSTVARGNAGLSLGGIHTG